MNALILSDLHAHTSWPFSHPLPDGTPSRFQDLLNVLAQAERMMEENNVDALFLLGDLTHRRHFINFRLYNALLRQVARLTMRVKRAFLIPGNHDYEDTATHSLYAFAYLPNVTLVDEPRIVAAAHMNDILLVPWMPDVSRIVTAFERCPRTIGAMAHYAAEGAPMETDWWLESPLKLGEVGELPWTIFGHVHKPSEQLNGRVQYVGAPMHFDFGDHGPRGGLRYVDGIVERVWFTAPQFATAKYPRIPRPPAGGGYLRITDVPAAEAVDVRTSALQMGWLDATTIEAALPPEIREAVLSGLILNEALLADYVRRRCPDMQPGEQALLVTEGLTLLQEARRA